MAAPNPVDAKPPPPPPPQPPPPGTQQQQPQNGADAQSTSQSQVQQPLIEDIEVFIEPFKQVFRKMKKMERIVLGISAFIFLLMAVLTIIAIVLSVNESRDLQKLKSTSTSTWKAKPCRLCTNAASTFKTRYRALGNAETDGSDCEMPLKDAWSCVDFKMDEGKPVVVDHGQKYVCVPFDKVKSDPSNNSPET